MIFKSYLGLIGIGLLLISFGKVFAEQNIKGKTMKFGMQVVMTAQEGQGDKLASIMLKASEIVSGVKGCHIYIVQQSLADEDKVLIAEVWENEEAHKSSLGDAKVLALITEARPLIADIEHHAAKPLGGKGL